MPRPINNMHRIPISGIENKKCGTVSGVGVNTRSYYRISSKPRVTNYTYESLQRALYPNNPKYDGQPWQDNDGSMPSATAVKELAKYRICKTVTLNNKVLIPTNVYLYIPPCVTLNILQSGSIITDGDGERRNLSGGGLLNSGTINNRGTINNNGGQIINTTGSLITNYGIIINDGNGGGDIFNDFYSDGVGGTIDTRYGNTVGAGPQAGAGDGAGGGTVLGEWGVDNR